RQEHEANDTAEMYGFGFSKDTEEPAGSILPTGSISTGPADQFLLLSTLFMLLQHHFLLVTHWAQDIHHHPDTSIFSSSSYDDDFSGTVTNLAPSVAVDPVPTKRVNTIHPQS
ncbi:hypothetical protein Tco_0298015, partial [Tanacetum coccineum]